MLRNEEDDLILHDVKLNTNTTLIANSTNAGAVSFS